MKRILLVALLSGLIFSLKSFGGEFSSLLACENAITNDNNSKMQLSPPHAVLLSGDFSSFMVLPNTAQNGAYYFVTDSMIYSVKGLTTGTYNGTLGTQPLQLSLSNDVSPKLNSKDLLDVTLQSPTTNAANAADASPPQPVVFNDLLDASTRATVTQGLQTLISSAKDMSKATAALCSSISPSFSSFVANKCNDPNMSCHSPMPMGEAVQPPASSAR